MPIVPDWGWQACVSAACTATLPNAHGHRHCRCHNAALRQSSVLEETCSATRLLPCRYYQTQPSSPFKAFQAAAPRQVSFLYALLAKPYRQGHVTPLPGAATSAQRAFGRPVQRLPGTQSSMSLQQLVEGSKLYPSGQ
jgi:hypothetical protein